MLHLLMYHPAKTKEPYVVAVFSSERRAKLYIEATCEVEGHDKEDFDIWTVELDPWIEGIEEID